MSALSLHAAGDCWWPCHYCQVEDSLEPEFLEPDYDPEDNE